MPRARLVTHRRAKPRTRDLTAWRRVNRLQLAELVGVHPDTISDYSRRGMPTTTRGGLGKESVYDAVACLAWWRDQNGQNAKEAAQTRAYEAQAKLNEQRLLERRQQLVARDQVLLAGQHFVRAWTAKIRALPRRFLELGVVPRDQEEAAAALCREVLQEVSGWKVLADVKRASKAPRPPRKAAA